MQEYFASDTNQQLLSSFQSFELSRLFPQGMNLLSPNNIQPNGSPSQNSQILRFSADKSSPAITLSASGLMATCYQEKEHLLLTNKSYSCGKIYWECIAPQDCSGIHMGIVETTANMKTISLKDTKSLLVASFRTTTPRIIGMQIDFDENKLRYWLNGNLAQSRIKNIQPGSSYIPCVVFNFPKNPPFGCQIIINPFSSLEIKTHFHSNFKIENPQSYISISKVEDLFDMIKNIQYNTTSSSKTDLNNSSLFEFGNNLLIVKDNLLKMVRKNHKNSFELNKRLFVKSPETLTDRIILDISLKDLKYWIIHSLIQTNEIQLSPLVEALIKSIKNDLTIIQNDEHILQFEMEFQIAFQLIQSLIKLEENKSNNLLVINILIHLDEQMYQMIHHSNSQNCLLDLYQITSRPFTCYHRLQSLTNYPITTYNPLELAEKGIINSSDIQFSLRHFLALDQELEPLTLLNCNQANISHISSNEPQPTIPLHNSINYFPVTTFQLKIIKIIQCREFVVIFFENLSIKIFSIKLFLLALKTDTFIEEKKEDSPKSSNLKPDLEPVFFSIFQENLFEDAEEQEEIIEPNLDFLDQLLLMGYGHEVAKLALIKTKNAGMVEAIDAIPDIIEQIKNSSQKQKDKKLLSWSCPDCTFINFETNFFCEVCDKEAPENAYIIQKIDDAIPENQPKKSISNDLSKDIINSMKPSAKASIDIPMKQQQEFLFANPKLVGQFVQTSTQSLQHPLLVGMILQDKSLLRIKLRQYGYHKDYISQFYHEDPQTLSLTCAITGRTLLNQSPKTKERFIFAQESSFSIELLAPAFTINQEQQFWDVSAFYDFDIDADSILDFTISVKDNLKDEHYLMLLIERNGLFYNAYFILHMKNSENAMLHHKLVSVTQITVGLQLDKPCNLKIESDEIFIFNNTNAYSIKDNLVFQKELPYIFQSFHVYKNALCIEGIKNNNPVLIISNSFRKSLDQEMLAYDEEITTFDFQNWSFDLIKYIKKLKKMQPLPSIALSCQQSSKIDHTSQIYTHHYYQMDQKQKTIDIVLPEAMNISGVYLDLTSNKCHAWFNQNKESFKSIFKADSLFIPLKVISFKGAQYNAQIPVSNLLFPNDLFVSNYPKTSFIFENLHKKQMLINSVKVQQQNQIISSQKPLHGGYPIGSGLIFLSNNPAIFHKSQEMYANMQPDEYQIYLQELTGSPEEYQPVGCFTEDQSHVELDFKRPALYIFLLPTNMRKSPENFSKFFLSYSIEIKFFGVQGQILEEEIENIQNRIEQCILPPYIEQVFYQINNIWQEVNCIVNSDKKFNENHEKNCHFWLLKDMSSVQAIRLVFKADSDLTSLNVELFKTLKNRPENAQFLSQLNYYNDFYKKLVLNMTSNDHDERIKSINVINHILQISELDIYQIFQDIDFVKFINLNILQSQDSIMDIQNLIQTFLKDQEIQQKMFNIFQSCLKNIENFKMTSQGLHHFMTILQFFPNSLEDEFLCKLQQTASSLRKLKNPYYSILRCQYQIASLAFEKELFSRQNCFFSEHSIIQSVNQSFLPVSFYTTPTYSGIEMVIHLDKTYDIKEILICVNENPEDKFKFKQKMRIQIYSFVQNDSKKLIHDESLSCSTWHQLSQTAHMTSKFEGLFDPSQNLDCIGTGFIPDLQAKYLVVQVSHFLQPHAQSPDEKLATNGIFPLISGSLHKNQQILIPQIEQEFQQVKYESSHIILKNKQRFQVGKNENNKTIHSLLCMNSREKIMTKYEKESLQNQLRIQQDNLSKNLYYNRESGLAYKEPIVEICKSIEAIQIQLFTQEPKEVVHNVDFYYTLAMELTFLLRNSFKGQKIFHHSTSILPKLLEIFENLVIYECNISQEKYPQERCIYSNALMLIKEVIKSHLSDKQWLHFIISIINSFLSKPINFSSCAIKNLYSQKQLIESLNELIIPNEEIISFVAQKLGIKYNLTELKLSHKLQLQANLQQSIFLLTSILNLLNKGYKQKALSVVYDPSKTYHTDIFCQYCPSGKQIYIEGFRLKCLNCPNVNICANNSCYDKHRQEFKDHSFIIIEEPLPLIPDQMYSKSVCPSTQKVFDFVEPQSTFHHENCDICLGQVGDQPRMLCANCEEYSICYSCFNLQKHHEKHAKYHVFVRIDFEVKTNVTSSSKRLFQVLDPMLYPFFNQKIESNQEVQEKSGKQRTLSNYSDDQLEPLKIKRFFSHQQKLFLQNRQHHNLLIIDENDELINIPKLDVQQSFVVTFGICVWICDNQDISESDKRNLLFLSFDLLTSILALSNPNGIKEMLKNQNHFLSLIFNIWKYGSQQQIQQLKVFLNKLISLNENQPSLEHIRSEIKSLILYHLQTFQSHLFEPNFQLTLYHQLFSQHIPINLTVEHLIFTLEFLLDSEQNLSKNSEQKSDLIPLGINKSLSYNQDYDYQKPAVFQCISIQNTMFTVTLVKKWILLFNNSKISFQNLAKLWTLVIRTISQFNIEQLIDNNLFELIVQSFFNASEDIQNIILQKLLQLTKSLLSSGNQQSDMCSMVIINIQVLSIIFKCLEQQNTILNFRLITGWLDTLLNLNKSQNSKSVCILDLKGISALFQQISMYLKKHLNIGGHEGAELSSEILQLKLKVASDFFELLLFAQSSSKKEEYLAIHELFANNSSYTQLIKSSIFRYYFQQRYIEWYLNNKSTTGLNSPSNTYIQFISSHLKTLFVLIKDYDEITQLALCGLISACKNQDEIIKKHVKNFQLPHYIAHKLTAQWCEIMEQLFTIWLTSDSLALHSAFEVKGLEFLLNKINPQEDIPHTSQEMSEKSQEIIFQEEECANSVQIQNLPQQNIVNYPPDWSIYKKGNKTKLFYFDMSGPFYDEYELVVKLQNPIQMKKLIMGFNSATIEINCKVLGVPSSILLEGGMEMNLMSPLGTLEPIQDNGYSMFSVSVFRKNFMQMDCDGDKLSDQIKSLNYPQVQYLKFIIRRPHITFVENLSYLNNKVWKNIFVSLSFLSIQGFNSNKLPINIIPALHEIQKNMALCVIGKLCDPTYTETLNILANNQEMVQKIKFNFEMLQGILSKYKNWLVPVFLAIANHNPNMGDWLTSKFLEFNRGDSHSKLVLEIILVSKEHSFKRIKMVYDCIMQNLNNLVFLETFCSAIRLIPIKEKILVSHKDIDLLLTSYHSNNKDSIIRLIISLIYTFNIDLLEYTVEQIWNLIGEHKKFDYLCILGPLLLGNQSIINQINQTRIQYILDKAIAKLTHYSFKQNNKLYNLLHFLYCIISCKDIAIHNQIKKQIFTMYNAMKIKNDLKDLEVVHFELLFKIFKDLVIEDVDLQITFTLQLIEDLSLLSQKKVVIFAEQFLVPYLNANSEIPVCLHPYYYQSKCMAYEGFSYTIQAQDKDLQLSKILSKNEAQQLMEVTKASNSKIFVNKKFQYTMVADICLANSKSYTNIADKILKQVLEQPPYLVILHGTHGDKAGVLGVYCTEKIQYDVPEETGSYESCYQIPYSDNNFVFYSENDCMQYFQLINYDNEKMHFGYYYTQQDQPHHLNLGESIFINFESPSSSNLDFDHSLYKQLDFGKPSQIKAILLNQIPEFLLDYQIKRMEFWVIKPGQGEIKHNENFIISNFFQQKLPIHSPMQYFRNNPVLYLPKQMTLQSINNLILNKKHLLLINEAVYENNTDILESLFERYQKNGILDIYFDIQEQDNQKLVEQNSQFSGLFNVFQNQGGVQKLIEVLLKSLTQWKNKDRSQKWFMWVKWNSAELEAVKFSYKILAQVFQLDTSSAIRLQAFEKQIIQSILDRLHYLSKEVCRKWRDTIEQHKEIEEIIVQKSEDPDKKAQKKQGVGYGSDNTGQNTKWNVSEYQQNVALKYEQIEQLLHILENFFDFKEQWKIPQNLIDLILSSCLLPMLESDFRSSSLLEMSKNSQIYHRELSLFIILDLVRLFRNSTELSKLLEPISPHYHPRQTDSVFSLLKKLKESADIFLKVKKSTEPTQKDQIANNKIPNSETLNSEDCISLSEKIVKTYEYIESFMENSQQSTLLKYIDIQKLSLNEQYHLLLKDLRFSYVSMKEDNVYKHHYSSYLDSQQTPSQQKIIRLAQELADLSNALPIDHTNAIFVRCDKDKIDVLKALIFGASDTPYGGGAYEFDIYFEDSYPATPPKVNLMTTGGGQVRFNPNLYACGKVCLSLLGTWRGNASENWDPKLSTLLQVLVSIQAIIMSDDVYFNEPGFENEAGSKEGQEKNEAYSNIVRYCNIMYAMVGQIQKPSKGFEEVIRRHFWIKRDSILRDVTEWLNKATKKSALYGGLVSDHNSNWCIKYKVKGAYEKMLKEAITKLDECLKSLDIPSLCNELPEKKTEKTKNNKLNKQQLFEQKQTISVNVDYDSNINQKELNFDSEEVLDRWSRNIGVMGIDSLKKQANSKILLIGLSGLGIEIAKNIVLSGVKKLTILDDKQTTWKDVCGQFFLSEADVGKPRITCLEKIRHLNNYVRVEAFNTKFPQNILEIEAVFIKDYSCVVVTEGSFTDQVILNEYCRTNKVSFISCSVDGVFSKVFNDFGMDFEVLDKNGEECPELFINCITNEENGVVTLLKGQKHNLEDGDHVLIYGVQGMNKNQEMIMVDKSISNQIADKNNGINQTIHKVKVINSQSFSIGDTTLYTPYQRQGLCKQIKMPIKLQFRSLSDNLQNPKWDDNLQIHDFMKLSHQKLIHCAYQGLEDFKTQMLRDPIPYNQDDSFLIKNLATINYKKFEDVQFNEETSKQNQLLLQQFADTSQGSFPPLQAFIGGFVAQEIIKSVTHKFTPCQSIFYMDCCEILSTSGTYEPLKDRYQALSICIGKDWAQKLQEQKIFMVGVGALGCELLKNFAMVGLGTNAYLKNAQGKIVITDPDSIELSNLSRQFLFREKHIGLPKSLTATAAVQQMNSDLKDSIVALTNKVCDQTINIFSEEFFESQDIICNALDNVQARRYMDMRCVSAKKPLLESGTLGPKGHLQVILPYQTESYESANDPQEDGEIPQCTLKMFPEESDHCIEWARDKFCAWFTQKPKSFLSYLDNPSVELKQLKQAYNLAYKPPKNFTDCIHYARRKFQKYFNHNILQLMHTYPLDAVTKEGKLFWTLPKRPPTPVEFNINDQMHVNAIAALACLRARIYKIQIPENPRSEKIKKIIAMEALNAQVAQFIPSDQKSQSIKQEILNQDNPSITNTISQAISNQFSNINEKIQETVNQNPLDIVECEIPNEFKNLQLKMQDILNQKPLFQIQSEEFEKDNDSNFHIDFINAFSNIRCQNYHLEQVSFIQVKLKAGKIIPALPTTTSCIAALQTIELIKTIKKVELQHMKNAFINLAINFIQLTEPGAALKVSLTPNLSVTLWDRWEVNCSYNIIMEDFLAMLQSKYILQPQDVFWKGKMLHMSKMKTKTTSRSLIELLGEDWEIADYVDLVVTFTLKEGDDILKQIPGVRVIFESQKKV